jgi:hypothetical protein
MSFQYSDAVITVRRNPWPWHKEGLPTTEWSHGLKWWNKAVYRGSEGSRHKYDYPFIRIQYPDGQILELADGEKPRCIWAMHSLDQAKAKIS